MLSALSYPFALGLAAAVNPCGFPMLPAYLSFFLGEDRAAQSALARVRVAVVSAGAVAVGFVAVFALLGSVVELGVSVFMAWVPWVMIVLGALMVAFAAVRLAGHGRLALPHLRLGGRERTVPSMVGFGASYAVASLTCSLPLFLAAVAGSFTRVGPARGLGSFVAYALGMAAILTVVTVAVAVARTSVVAALRRGGRYLDKAGSVLLLLAGAYLVYYWIVYLKSPSRPTRPVSAVEGLQSRLTALVSGSATEWAILALAVAAVVALLAVVGRSRLGRRRAHRWAQPEAPRTP